MSRHIRMGIWFETAWVDGEWADRVRVSDAGVEAGTDPVPSDERHAIAVPGLPNVHSHAFQRGMAGLAEARGPGSDDFWSWRELMYRFVDRLSPDDLEAIAAQAYAEMLESGFTHVGEFHYLHHAPDGHAYADPAEMAARIAAAAEDTGIGLTLLPVFYAHGGFGGAPAGAAQRRFLNTPDSFARLVESARSVTDNVGIAPHSLRAVTPDELRAILPLGGPVHIHIAEQVKEVADCIAWSGKRPVEWLLGEMPVGRDWTLVHATHVTDAERSGIAASGAVAGLCPITEANLGDGLFPAAPFLDEGGLIGVGSDSNVRIDAAEELRLLEYGQRLTARARNVLAAPCRSTGARLFEAALNGGRRSLGLDPSVLPRRQEPRVTKDIARDPGLLPSQEDKTGGGDWVSLNPKDPAFANRSGDAMLDSWIFAARAPVDCVWRDGVKLVAGGRHIHATAIATRYRHALARILS